MRIETSVVIARAPADVWSVISEPLNDRRWCEKVESSEQIAGAGPGPGASYRVSHRPRPRRGPTELAVTVEEWEPPRRLRLREEDEDAVFDVTYRLEQVAGGTKLTQTDEIAWKIALPARPIGRLMVSRDLRRQFKALKELLESESP